VVGNWGGWRTQEKGIGITKPPSPSGTSREKEERARLINLGEAVERLCQRKRNARERESCFSQIGRLNSGLAFLPVAKEWGMHYLLERVQSKRRDCSLTPKEKGQKRRLPQSFRGERRRGREVSRKQKKYWKNYATAFFRRKVGANAVALRRIIEKRLS